MGEKAKWSAVRYFSLLGDERGKLKRRTLRAIATADAPPNSKETEDEIRKKIIRLFLCPALRLCFVRGG